MEAIDYATRERQHGWLRRNLKRIVVVAICAAVGILAHRNWRPIDRYVSWHYWHWQLARYEMSPRDAIAPPTTVPTSPTAGTRHAARPIAGLRWGEFAVSAGKSYTPNGPVGFDYVGQRRRPDGASRTVVIALEPDLYRPFSRSTVRVIRRPGPLASPPLVVFGCLLDCDDSGPKLPALVECVADPADPSAILVTLHPSASPDGRAFAVTRMRARLTNADRLDWTLESCDERTKPMDIPTPPTVPALQTAGT